MEEMVIAQKEFDRVRQELHAVQSTFDERMQHAIMEAKEAVGGWQRAEESIEALQSELSMLLLKREGDETKERLEEALSTISTLEAELNAERNMTKTFKQEMTKFKKEMSSVMSALTTDEHEGEKKMGNEPSMN